MRNGWRGLLTGALSLVLVLMAVSPALAVAPVGKHYITVVLLLDPDTRQTQTRIGCLSFTRDEVCNENGDCGPFEFIEKLGTRNVWRGAFELTQGGVTLAFLGGDGLTERRQPGSSIGGTALVAAGGRIINGSFAGVQAPLAECLAAAASDG